MTSEELLKATKDMLTKVVDGFIESQRLQIEARPQDYADVDVVDMLVFFAEEDLSEFID